MILHRYLDHQRLHIVTKDVISLSISVLLLFRHYISHKITFGAPSSGGVLRSACGAFIQDVIGCTSDVDFFLWPRKDIDKIQCMLFSRWKGETSPYRQILVGYSPCCIVTLYILV